MAWYVLRCLYAYAWYTQGSYVITLFCVKQFRGAPYVEIGEGLWMPVGCLSSNTACMGTPIFAFGRLARQQLCWCQVYAQ